MSTELLMTPPGSDTSTDVERVVSATRHLNDFRTGYAEALEQLALRATEYMPDNGKAHLEPMLRILGDEASGRFAERLYRIASDVTGGWNPNVNPDRALETLHLVVHEAVEAVWAQIGRDSCICREVTR